MPSSPLSISIHSPLVGRDTYRRLLTLQNTTFQSTLPTQRKTFFPALLRLLIFSIHSPYAGRDRNRPQMVEEGAQFQSTPPPVRGETGRRHLPGPAIHISTHSPYTGRDLKKPRSRQRLRNFNPLSLYRERRWRLLSDVSGSDFNPLSPCGERHSSEVQRRVHCFNPLSPCGERRGSNGKAVCGAGISIHSSHTGRD